MQQYMQKTILLQKPTTNKNIYQTLNYSEMAKFTTKLATSGANEANDWAPMTYEFDPIETGRRIEKGDVIDFESFHGSVMWRFWRVVEIVHQSSGTVALCEYVPTDDIYKSTIPFER